MAEKSKIEWCDDTFNPWIGCTEVGPGCDHCYAKADFDHRKHRVKWGVGNPRSRTSVANWKKPLQWNAQPFVECGACGWRGEKRSAHWSGTRCPVCNAEAMGPSRRRVFCASLADVFDNEVPAEWRADLFWLIHSTPNLDWLLVTKRIGNAAGMMRAAMLEIDPSGEWPAPWPNVWLGITVVNQAEADRDIPKLLGTPAAVRFLSMEPLLGPVNVSRFMWPVHARWPAKYKSPEEAKCAGETVTYHRQGLVGAWCKFIDWVIVGGESGPHARPMHPQWARDIRDQCEVAGVPFLFKQWGEWSAHDVDPDGTSDHLMCIDMAGGECFLARGERSKALGEPWWFLPAWPGRGTWGPDGIPPGVMEVRKVGKKAAGRCLDGREHNAFPAR